MRIAKFLTYDPKHKTYILNLDFLAPPINVYILLVALKCVAGCSIAIFGYLPPELWAMCLPLVAIGAELLVGWQGDSSGGSALGLFRARARARAHFVLSHTAWKLLPQ